MKKSNSFLLLFRLYFPSQIFIIFVLVFSAAGCRESKELETENQSETAPAPVTPPAPASVTPSAPASVTPSAPAPVTPAEMKPSETPDSVVENALFLCYADSLFIGTEQRTTLRYGEMLRVQDVSRLNLNRYGNQVSAEVRHEEEMKANGELVRFSSVLSMGGEPMRYEGTLVSENSATAQKEGSEPEKRQIQIPVVVSSKSSRQTQTLRQTLPFAGAQNTMVEVVSGGYGLETALLLTPLHSGETRNLIRINPTMLRLELVELCCSGAEKVTLPDGNTFQLLRVETVSHLFELDGTLSKAQYQEETVWCDGNGRIWKRFSPLMNLSAWRTNTAAVAQYARSGQYPAAPDATKTSTETKDGVEASSNAKPTLISGLAESPDFAQSLNAPLTFGADVGAKVAASPRVLAEADEVVYRVLALSNESAERLPLVGLFESSDFQKVEELDEFTLQITVRKSGLSPFSEQKTSERTAELEDSQPGPMIQSDAPEIMALAQSVLPGETNAAKLGPELERFVYRFIQNKNYSRGFVTALEVAENPTGDCTEHAVFFAALARARGIPARVSQGLIFEPHSGRMAWHVWNELYFEGRWHPFDATLGRGGVSPDHIRINAGSFSTLTLSQTLLAPARLIGKIRISVDEVK